MRRSSSPDGPRFSSDATTRVRAPAGFTLVELVIVVLVLAILAAAAVPKLIDVSGDAELNATMETFKRIQDAANMYRAQQGVWPSITDASNAPGDFDEHLRRQVFLLTPTISNNGTLVWDQMSFGGTSYHGVVIRNVDVQKANELDSAFDDGNPTSGTIRIAAMWDGTSMVDMVVYLVDVS
jgi:prepilin-type N-terminal cleavage/methylation domain-containing protein